MHYVVSQVMLWTTLALSLLCLLIEVWALVVSLLLPADGYTAAGRSTKAVWSGVLTGVVLVSSFMTLLTAASPLGFMGMLCVIIAGVFLADVKPAVTELLAGSSRRGKGPLGLW